MSTEERRSAALQSIWSELKPTGTPEECLAAILQHTVAGAFADVPVSRVAGYLGIRGLLSSLEEWILTIPDATGQLKSLKFVAKELLRVCNNPGDRSFNTSADADRVALFSSLDGLEGLQVLPEQAVSDLKDMAATLVPWWRSTVFQSEPCVGDLVVAGLVPKPTPPQDK